MNELIPPVLLEPGSHLVLRVVLSLLPVLLFLVTLVWLDSFRLVRRRRVVTALVAGAIAALLSYVVNSVVLDVTGMTTTIFAILVAPLVEEAAKAGWIIREIRRRRVGFLIDAAVLGFATGTGFAIVENLYYLRMLGEVPLLVWLVRGLGTALMHGGTTAILAVYLRGRTGDDRRTPPWLAGVLLVTLVHAAFNRYMTEPVLATAAMAVLLPLLMFAVYRLGERRLRRWLGQGFDRDRELLALINEGQVQASPLGRYLVSLRENFRADTVADMLCLLRLQVELSLRAKGTLILREQGLRPSADPDLPDKLVELAFLERRIGRTGLLAMRPICHWRDADRWQRHLLAEEQPRRQP